MVAPMLVPFVDANPCPRVEVFFGSFLAGTASVTVYRMVGRREMKVRGAVRAHVAGTLTRIDFEVPFNATVTYRAEMFNAAGLSLGFTETSTIRLDVADTWMHNPLNPQGAVKCLLLAGSGKSISRPVPGAISYPIGRRVGVVLAQPRHGVAGVQIDMLTETLDDADRVQAFLGDYSIDAVPVVCVRLGSNNRMRLPQPLFLGVLDIPEEDVDVFDGGEAVIQHMKGDEVDPPIPGLLVPLLRAKDINVSFSTARALNQAHLTGAAVNRRYDLAGAAG